MNPIGLIDLFDAVLNEVVARSDPPTTLALSLTSKAPFSRYFPPGLVGYKSLASCVENSVRALSLSLSML